MRRFPAKVWLVSSSLFVLLNLIGYVWLHSASNSLTHALGTVSKTLFEPDLRQIVFVFVGAVRTLSVTQPSLRKHVIDRLCPPNECIAHVVTHFSSTDNRPDTVTDSPFGLAQPIVSNNFTWSRPGGNLVHHLVPGYDIGSKEEAEAMEEERNKCDDSMLRIRMKALQYGDPRRFSMWFARSFAWEHVKADVLPKYNIHSFFFSRPDMFWIHPAPEISFFKINSKKEREVWTHDMYYKHTADTWAYIPSKEVADVYFSMTELVKPKTACIGGPNNNETVSRARLVNQSIEFPDETNETYSMFCSGGPRKRPPSLALSEAILRKKLANGHVHIRVMPMGTAILRPSPKGKPRIDCYPLTANRLFMEATYAKSHVNIFGCLVNQLDIEENWTRGEAASLSTFRWIDRRNKTLCVGRNLSSNVLELQPCTFPIPPWQLFSGSRNTELIGYDNTTSDVHIVHSLLRNLTVDWERADRRWRKEVGHATMYTEQAMEPVASICGWDRFCTRSIAA
uniref:Uncharacterized protein n=1 Tax=Grammatophora oceanica TaxID=210454 RepID=A0A7S1VUY4_9STRA|mmetsp:Transcript_8771/g.12834  ORF Transcript_8771/g.12834 Transcript_8771/m.12834 type:complete len:509 (+) Transcript_8771:224-1750(+)|eukprot:CAMPEP_0194052638 /NCGR_PEP_ID=MMETSP0009_2-20130614/46352_1 /TAXON_ID=210454 /ORGANISM="Grammatophora oceanica, Strain CCMP 410" /LENGTH=508 /DNA_ID=CAMNT_0038700329 /DNA_START=140 /DNA_END=1666 /DNA_ORIENTATION=+